MVERRERSEAKIGAATEERPETLIYMKLRIDRPAEELKTILNSLKE
ncbi:MAG: hypothetical protein OEZ24_01010 [Candidatus Bathyarchaeota archaeon]|nr:hypothetical protein [Candidatus Bathyarchaeota archaeon]